MWEQPEGFSDNFGTPSNDIGDSQPQKDPQERIPQLNVHIRHGSLYLTESFKAALVMKVQMSDT